MKFLILNQNWFSESLRELGHEVLVAGFREDLPLKIPPFSDISKIVAEDLKEFAPDVVIWLDDSSPSIYHGFENLTCLSVFYSVDVHHHHRAHKFMSQMFDITLVAQKDYLHYFESVGISSVWFPLWASRYAEPEVEKVFDSVFIGTMNPELNPERVSFFEELKTKIPVHIAQGCWWEIFTKSKIVINQTVRGDLNFRVFEALISGALLLTEKSENGLSELFKDSVHLITYEKNNTDDASEKIKTYLNNTEKAQEIARAGREEVLKNHTEKARSLELLSLLEKTNHKVVTPFRFHGALCSVVHFARSLRTRAPEAFELQLVLACDLIEKIIQSNESPITELAVDIVYVCILISPLKRDGYALIDRLIEKYPEMVLFHLVKTRKLLNDGKLQEASLYAKHFNFPEKEIFEKAEEVVQSILKFEE